MSYIYIYKWISVLGMPTEVNMCLIVSILCSHNTVEPVLRDHYHEAEPVLEDRKLAWPTFQYSWTCHQQPLVSRPMFPWLMERSF